jgi:hypothetical protein
MTPMFVPEKSASAPAVNQAGAAIKQQQPYFRSIFRRRL